MAFLFCWLRVKLDSSMSIFSIWVATVYVLIEKVDHVLLVLRQFVTFVKSFQFAQVCVRSSWRAWSLGSCTPWRFWCASGASIWFFSFSLIILGIQIDWGVLHLQQIEHQQLILTNFGDLGVRSLEKWISFLDSDFWFLRVIISVQGGTCGLFMNHTCFELGGRRTDRMSHLWQGPAYNCSQWWTRITT